MLEDGLCCEKLVWDHVMNNIVSSQLKSEPWECSAYFAPIKMTSICGASVLCGNTE